MSIELKPCDCGGAPLIVRHAEKSGVNVYAECRKCGAHGPRTKGNDEAVEAWNRNVTHTAACSLGAGCDEAGVCFAAAHGDPSKCGRPDATPPAAQVQVEQPEVVGQLALDEPFNGTEGLEIGEWEFVPERAVVESMLAESTGEMVPLMTVAQHQRIVSALSGENERLWSDRRRDAALISELRAALSAPPAAGVPDASSHEALLKRLAEAQEVLVGVKRYAENNGYRFVEVERFLAGITPARQGKDPITLFGEICHVLAVLGAPEKVMEQVSAAAEGDPISEASLLPFTAPTPPASEQQQAVVVSAAAADVLAERRRQVEAEQWTPEHDDEHDAGVLAAGAAAYALNAADQLHPFSQGDGGHEQPSCWPWAHAYWKPGTPRRDLIKAGALILAEIERIDRDGLRLNPHLQPDAPSQDGDA